MNKPRLAIITLPPETPDCSLRNTEDVVALLGRAINDVMRGRISIGIGHCVSQLASVLLKALDGEAVEAELAAWRAEKEKRKGRRAMP